MTRARRLLFLAMLAAPACGGPLHPVTSADVDLAAVRFPGTTRAELEAGRKLTLSHCARCHRPFEPEEFRADAWPALVREMKKPAGLDDEEEALVVRYLTIAAEAGLRKRSAKQEP